MRNLGRLLGIAGLGALALGGCAGTAPPSPSANMAAIVAPYRPPPKRAEIPPPPPSPRALWLVGHWRWTGSNYVWTPGHYVERPAPTANWVPDYWMEQKDGWTFVAGRWAS